MEVTGITGAMNIVPYTKDFVTLNSGSLNQGCTVLKSSCKVTIRANDGSHLSELLTGLFPCFLALEQHSDSY